MRYASRAILAGGLGFAVSFIAACGGGSGLLSGNQSSSLKAQLDQVSSAVAANDCVAASSAANGLSNDVFNLPPSVNATLRRNLTDGATTVGRLAQQDCQKTTSSTASNTTATTTSTASTSTSTSATAPTTTTQTQSTSSTQTQPATTSATTTTDTGTSSTTTDNGGAGLGGPTTTGAGVVTSGNGGSG